MSVGVPDCGLLEISGDCCSSTTTLGFQSEELCMMWRVEGRLVRLEIEGRISGMFGVEGGVENVSLSGECMMKRGPDVSA